MSAGRFALVLLFIVGAFGVGWLLGTRTPNALVTSTAPEESDATLMIARVVAQGKLVPANGIHNVLTSPGQRIESVLVAENDAVVANKTQLATVEGEQVLDLQTDLVDAQADEALAQLDQKILRAKSSLVAAEAAVQSAKWKRAQADKGIDLTVSHKQVDVANEKLARLLKLQEDPDTQLYVSAGEVVDQQLAIEQAESQIEAARRKQKSALEASLLAVDVALQSRDSAQRALQALEGLRKNQRSATLSKQIAADKRAAARIISPVSGTVLKVLAKQGDVSGNLPLIQIADLSDMQCIAEVVDRLVGAVKIGQRATITSPALETPISGKVISIGRFVGQSTMPQPSPFALVDRKTVDVRIKIDADDVDTANQLVNLQVTVEIDPDR